VKANHSQEGHSSQDRFSTLGSFFVFHVQMLLYSKSQMNKSFYLIRHGDKIKTIGDPGLTELGISQAQATAHYLKKFPVSGIFASPFLRTRQTAEIISQELSLTVIIEPLLRERANWGDDPDQSFLEFIEMWRQASIDRDWQPSVGDTSRSAGQRLQAVIEALAPTSDNVVIVTHGGIISDFVRNVFPAHIADEAITNFSQLGDQAVKECSITTIGFDPENQQFSLQSLASCAHL
jgi:2,3-bisphosphoglycerate-dependent phosphoglycerate mutase/probable phosphoglycerate mutase